MEFYEQRFTKPNTNIGNKNKVIAIANQKGGVGKTTLTFNFGICLAEKGYKVLLIDFDSQGNLTYTCGINDPDSLKETIATALKDTIDNSDIIRCKTYCYKKYSAGNAMDFIPANIGLANVNLEMVIAMGREYLLCNVLKPLKDIYDYILIDCAPSLSVDLINALVVADEVIIPTIPATYSTLGTEQLVKSIRKVKLNFNHKLQIAGMIFNDIDKRTNFTKDMLSVIRQNWGNAIHIFNTEITHSVKLEESQAMNKPIIEYAPENKVALAYRSFTEEYLERSKA